MIRFASCLCLLLSALSLMLTGCSSGSSSSSSSPSTPATIYSATLTPGPAGTGIPVGAIGFTLASSSPTLTNTGTGTLTLSGIALSGSGAPLFGLTGFSFTNECAVGAVLVPGASCIVPYTFSSTGSGTFTAVLTVTDNATAGPQTATLTGTAIATAPASATVDCSVNAATCADTFTGAYTTANAQLASDPIATGGFHGYADPSIRKDPNSSITYLAYSWARTLADGTHVVDLHLASSANNGSTFTEVGPLYQSAQTTQTTSTAYSGTNDSSTETVDLLPIPLTGSSAGQTLWVQAHQSYLVKPQAGIYDQLDATGIISLTAVQLATPAAAGAGASLLALGTAPEARLGTSVTDPSRNLTQNLASLNSAMSKCGNFGQPALWYVAGTLYLAVECSEVTGTGTLDANELAHFLFTTTPTGSDASKWTWTYAAEFATPAQAGKLGALPSENVAYQFFTEPEFAMSKTGQLVLLVTPSVFAPAGSQQPVIQYGCRAIPVASLSPTGITLGTDATTGAPVVTAKITENDLYTSPNEGPAACTYEPTASNGILIGRKFENDPTYGFYIYPVNTGIAP